MKIANWLQQGTKQLQDADIPTARLDCLVLLCDLLDKDKAFILAHPEIELTQQQLSTLNTQMEKRLNHVPLAYIRGMSEFYGRDFIVTKSVLEPRPESEAIIELLKKITNSTTIIDIGTGTGALAISAKLELPQTNVYAVDIDPACLAVAQQNANHHKAQVTLIEGNLLQPIDSQLLRDSVLLANLPYVPDSHALNRAATHEPRLAIFGGTDGLDLYRTLFEQITNIVKPGHIITESLSYQHDELRLLAAEHGYAESQHDGLAQVFTVSAQLQA